MKRYYSFLTILLLLCAAGAAKAQHLNQRQITLQNVKCEQKEGQIHLRMNVNAGKATLSSQEALILTPVIMAPGKEKALPSFTLAGSKRYKADQRAAYFNNAPFAEIKKGSPESFNIAYHQMTDYEPWMENAHIALKQESYGCPSCGKTLYSDSLTYIQFLKPVKPEGKPVLSYVRPVAEPVKNRNMLGQAYLDFPVGKSVIQADFRNNFQELSKIQRDIDQLKDDPNAMINAIVLEGFASPEGSYKTNERLSESRAQALKVYLQKRYDYNDNMFRVSSVAEDWIGLKKLVETSNLADQQAVLEIINNDKPDDTKEQNLKALKGGSVYKELLRDYFPQLRRVDYKLDYTIRAFSVEEGKEIIQTKPGQMSLNEMFLVANTYPKGSNEFNQVFDIAVRVYPNDKIANINAAAIVLGKGDTKTAHRYLDPYQDAPESWNNLGVLYLLEGNYSQAENFLTKAQAQGSAEAVQNLSLLKQYQEYEAKKELYNATLNK